MTTDGYRGCDRSHASPSCVDPDCYVEEHARRADTIMQGLGDFVRRGVLEPNLWLWVGDEILPPLRAMRTADPSHPATPDRLSDEEIIAWAERSGVYQESMKGTYLQIVVDEIRERRAAEATFAEIDRHYMTLECDTCDAMRAFCTQHAGLARTWSSARAALCDQVRIHRGYLLDLIKPTEIS